MDLVKLLNELDVNLTTVVCCMMVVYLKDVIGNFFAYFRDHLKVIPALWYISFLNMPNFILEAFGYSRSLIYIAIFLTLLIVSYFKQTFLGTVLALLFAVWHDLGVALKLLKAEYQFKVLWTELEDKRNHMPRMDFIINEIFYKPQHELASVEQ